MFVRVANKFRRLAAVPIFYIRQPEQNPIEKLTRPKKS